MLKEPSPRLSPAHTRGPRAPRRRFATIGVSSLIVGAIGLTTVLSACGAFENEPISTVGEIEFDTPLSIPPLAESSVDGNGVRHFALAAQDGESDFGQAEPTATWGFNGAYLGPTIVADAGERVAVEVTNRLDEPTTVHWHGMHIPPEMDGGPHQMIDPGETWTPEWAIDQRASTLWYHPHPHGNTEEHVRKGLAGMFIVRDDAERSYGLPDRYGVDDVPVIVQDAQLDQNGQLRLTGGSFAGVLGDDLLVNGTVGPFFSVTTEVVRLRLLNGSSARSYNFVFADDREFALIASDGGLLDAPLTTSAVQLSPGERAEILVRMDPGENVVLRSAEQDLGGALSVMGPSGTGDTFDVLELRAADSLEARGRAPSAFEPIERLDESTATVERSFTLDGTQINQQNMDLKRIDEVVEVGATEIWTVRNGMAAPHNFHVHDVQFQVLTIGGDAPPPQLAGWKDTVYLEPNTDYRLIMRFEDYADRNIPYMYHCHLLAHEDRGMMGQFVVVEPGQSAGTPPAAHAGHTGRADSGGDTGAGGFGPRETTGEDHEH
ncbi:multicopper oxidase domain-containing protein [Okibacterium endophyticum]